MFTPPPSPLPGAHFPSPAPAPSGGECSTAPLLSPPLSPPEKSLLSIAPSIITPDVPQPKKRRRYLPVLLAAVVLAIIAVSARGSTLHAVSARLPHTLPLGLGYTSHEPAGAHVGAEGGEGAHAGNPHGNVQARRLRRGHHEAAAANVERQASDSASGSASGSAGSGTPTVTLGTRTAGSSPSGSQSQSQQSQSSTTGSALPSNSAGAPVYTAAPAVPVPALPVPTPFPAPFDMALSFNITSPSCITFFNTFIQNVTFRACRPFSLLMSSSQQFAVDQDNLTTLTAVVGGTCATDMDAESCGQVMDWHATQIALPGNCGSDIDAKEALAVTALTGFRSYRMMRLAGCLSNPLTQAYCYVEAVASLLPNDLYFWTAALGVPLPNATNPTCSACTQSLLATYAQYATDPSLLISQTYPGAVGRARASCGQGYAAEVTVASAAEMAARVWGSGVLLGVMGVAALVLQLWT